MAEVKYKRIILKISGERFAGDNGFGIQADQLQDIAQQIYDVSQLGVQIGVVVGGGNFVRGKELISNLSIEEVTAHHMGMISTSLNALALRDALRSIGANSETLTSVPLGGISELYRVNRAKKMLEKGVIVLLACGTGQAFFTTDTHAALCGLQTSADIVLKGTQVDGVYDKDPEKNHDAVLYPEVSFDEAIEKNLAAMDSTAFALCREHHMPILVFNIWKKGNLLKIVQGNKIGTLVTNN